MPIHSSAASLKPTARFNNPQVNRACNWITRFHTGLCEVNFANERTDGPTAKATTTLNFPHSSRHVDRL